MNHDPIRFCFQCRQMKQAKDFRPLSREPGNPRWVCAGCFNKVEATRRERNEQAANPANPADRGAV